MCKPRHFPVKVKTTCCKPYLNRGGSIGSFCISTIRMTLCLAPELNATPCCEGVYLMKNTEGHRIKYGKRCSLCHSRQIQPTNRCLYRMYCAGACLSAARTGMAAAIFWATCFSRAALVFSVSLVRRQRERETRKTDNGTHYDNIRPSEQTWSVSFYLHPEPIKL